MSDPFQTQNAFSWTELRTGDVAGAKSFYANVIGWETEDMAMPNGTYTVLKAGGAPVGGIMQMPPDAGDAPAHWMTYITVDDVDDRVQKAEAAGGQVLMPPMDVPTVGRMATFTDPSGAAISVIKYAPRDG